MENNKDNNYNFNHEQLAFFKSIVDNVPDMIFVKEAKELRFVLFNKAGEELLGYPRKDMIGKNDYDFFPKDQADFFIAKDRATLNGEIVLDIPEEPIQTRYKGARILHTKKIPILDEKGKPVYLLGISDDITERKNFEKQLLMQESEKVFRVLFDSAVDGMILADIETKKFVMANKALCTKLKYSPEEITKLGVVDIHPEKDLSYVLDQFERQAKGEFSLAKDIPVKAKDGSVYYVDVNSSLFDFKGKKIQLGIFRDITERKNIENKLEEKTQELQTIFDAIPAWVFYKDKENRLVKVNESYCARMEKNKEELEGKSLSDLYPKEQADAFFKDDLEVIKFGKPKRNIIEPIKTPEGDLWLQTDKIPYYDKQNNIIGVIGFSLDITEQKKAQDTLERSNKLMAGRELKMVELKKEIKELKNKVQK